MRIREIIEEKGLTSKYVADKLGISISAFNQSISGNPSVKVLTRIADALEVPIWQLFASPSEIEKNKDEVSITCPKCGYGMKIKVE